MSQIIATVGENKYPKSIILCPLCDSRGTLPSTNATSNRVYVTCSLCNGLLFTRQDDFRGYLQVMVVLL